jgi:hypothetical protein
MPTMVTLVRNDIRPPGVPPGTPIQPPRVRRATVAF